MDLDFKFRIIKSKNGAIMLSMYIDEGTRSCGEFRTDWTHKGFIDVKDFLTGLETALKEGKDEFRC